MNIFKIVPTTKIKILTTVIPNLIVSASFEQLSKFPEVLRNSKLVPIFVYLDENSNGKNKITIISISFFKAKTNKVFYIIITSIHS